MIHFHWGFLREAVHHLTRAPGLTMLQYTLKVRRMSREAGDTIFVTAVPKSASSFLLRALTAVTGYPITRLSHGVERQEQDLYYPCLVDAHGQSKVTRHHTRATSPNLELMKAFQIRPVILVRNFFDVVPSIRDYLYREGFENFPCMYADDRFPDLDEATQVDAIIEMAMPWYFKFYAGWFDAIARREVDGLWMNFEEMATDWNGALRKILEFHGIERSDAEIAKALEHTRSLGREKTRLNEGKVGRGKLLLTEEQRGRIRDMARFYPWVDFGRVGIPRVVA